MAKLSHRKVSNHCFKVTLISSLLVSFIYTDIVHAELSPFFSDSSVNSTIYFWNRDRNRKKIETNEYESNLRHSTFNAALDFNSGYLADTFAIELGGYGAWEVTNGGEAHPNEIGFSGGNTRWDNDSNKDVSGVSFYKALARLQLNDGQYWLRAGYLQPAGQTLLAPHWSLLPGTYRGAEVGASFDFEEAGNLSISYMWTDKYKAPWYKRLYNFREKDEVTDIPYLHSLGAKYDFKNNIVLEAAFGQAQGYMNQYFSKVSYSTSLLDNPLDLSYQFYGANEQSHNGSDVYDGLAWLQAATMSYKTGPVTLRLEGTAVKAEGKQGFFLQRMTPPYASSNGRLDIWWNARSDFNANGEKAVFTELSYDWGSVAQVLTGLQTGISYVYAWDAKPSSDKAYNRIEESAWNLDVSYTVQTGPLQNTLLSLHYTDYDNHSNIPSWSGGYGNIFQDEKDIKFFVIMPMNIF